MVVQKGSLSSVAVCSAVSWRRKETSGDLNHELNCGSQRPGAVKEVVFLVTRLKNLLPRVADRHYGV